MRRSIACFGLALFGGSNVMAQEHEAARHELKWFQDAKLGLFIHWGIYSVQGVDESWAFYNWKMPYADYMKQLDGFTASKFDPAAWADLIARSGAKYAVITTKHHDGVALWPTRMAPGLPPQASPSLQARSTEHLTPAKRGFIDTLFKELRTRKLKCGAYFSLIDWSEWTYPAFTKDSTRYAIKDDPARWKQFQNYFQLQISEISSQLNPDLWWFDGDWEHNAEEWEAAKVRASILEKNPKAIINGRLQGYGDYATPEQNIPIETPKAPAWELCMTLGEQ